MYATTSLRIGNRQTWVGLCRLCLATTLGHSQLANADATLTKNVAEPTPTLPQKQLAVIASQSLIGRARLLTQPRWHPSVLEREHSSTMPSVFAPPADTRN